MAGSSTQQRADLALFQSSDAEASAAAAEASAATAEASAAAAEAAVAYPGDPIETPTAWGDPGIVYNLGADWNGNLEARITSDGTVYLRGQVTRSGSTGPGSPMFTLPAGFRPPAAEQQFLTVFVNDATPIPGLITVAPTGAVTLITPSQTTVDPAFVAVDGVTFSIK